jgi:nucleoside-diphosphate-sugar epimerase
MADIYITGAKGFIGKNLIKKLKKSESLHRIRPISHGLNYVEGGHIHSDFEDIQYLQRQIDYKNYNILINCAFYMPSKYIDIEPDKKLYTKNKDLVDFLVESFTGAADLRIINISSVDVYGCGKKKLVGVNEYSPLIIDDYYSRAQEYQERKFRINFRHTIDLRMSLVYGKHKEKETFLEDAVKKAINNEDIHIKGDGSSTRDYVYVEDAVNVINHFIEKSMVGKDTYNLTSGEVIETKKLAEDIIEIFDSKSNIKEIEGEERPSISFDSSKLKKETKINFRKPKEGISELKKYYIKKYKK